MKDGWHKYNPKQARCDVCGSSNVEFLWDNETVVGFRCLDCDNCGLDK